MEVEEKKERKSGWSIWNAINSIQGDKVVWMIVLLLMMMSFLVIFGSSSRLAFQEHSNRLEIIKDQALSVLLGLGIVFICYKWKWMKFVRIMSAAGFGISLFLLLIVFFHLNLGFIRAAHVNNSWRVIKIAGGPQIHIYEVVKVAMVMYISWAIDKTKGDGFGLTKWLQKRNLYFRRKDGTNVQAFEWLSKPTWEQIFYIYLPIVICVALTTGGSNSSALFLALLMTVTLVIGGMPMKKIILSLVAMLVLGGAFLGIYKATGMKSRQVETLLSRIGPAPSVDEYYAVKNLWRKTAATDPEKEVLWKKLDTITKKIQQPMAARIAVKEGGLIGKGPGGSTQQYVVPIMYGDYMYAFILEEYGAWGGLFVLVLYISLLARGSLITRNLDGRFEQIATGGLVILISGQAFMHMLINVGIGPLTGQTLPLLSHGMGAFLMMSLAFGIILYFSRLAKENIRRQEEKMAEAKEMESSLDDLDRLNNDLTEEQI